MSTVMADDRFTELSVKIGNRVFLDVRSVADIFGKSIRQTERIIKENGIRTVFFNGHKRRILVSSLLDFLRTEPSATPREKQLETLKRNR